MAQLLLALRLQFFPHDAFLMNGTQDGNILMYVSPFLPSIGVGMMLANFSVWMIRRARLALDGEAQETERTRFKKANWGLLKFVLITSIPTLLLATLGTTSYFYLTSRGIAYRTSILAAERDYLWSDVTGIETACWYNRGRQASYTLLMRDQTRVGILESYPDFLKAYPVLASVLNRHSYVFDHRGVAPRCEESLSPLWKRVLTTPPSP